MIRTLPLACALVLSGSAIASASAQPVTTLQLVSDAGRITTGLKPAQPLIERTRFGQALNFDFDVVNRSDVEIELRVVNLTVRDPQGAIAQKIEINDNGVAPGIEAIPNRKVAPGASWTLFNPIHTLPGDLTVGRLDYELTFATADKKRFTHKVSVTPRAYVPRTRLQLPLDGRLLIWDGHDFGSHHRRLDYNHFFVKDLGVTTNASRYSFDFVGINEAGEMRTSPEKRNDSYIIYRRPVLAPADGTVVAARGDVDEKRDITPEEMRADSMAPLGNYVVIDHGNGEFSQMGHFRENTLKVRVGDKVRAGQPIAEIGNSGSSIFPHLHYQLVAGPDQKSEGLPAYFHGYDRILGSRRVKSDAASIDSGDIVERR